MNKTYLIAGGASALSLVAGAAGGYLFAKKQFDEKLNLELEKTEKHYGVILTNMKYGVKPKLEDLTSGYSGEDEPLEIEEDPPPVKKGGSRPPKKDPVDYQNFASVQTAPSQLIEKNIFTDQSPPRKSTPPRDSTGKFVPAVATETPAFEKYQHGTPPVREPYPITEIEFASNDLEYDQDSALYFVNENTVVLTADYTDVIDNNLIGAIHLEKLAKGDREVMYIRHDGKEMDYQVTRTTDSLTVALGLGEDESDLDENDAAEHRTARADETVDDWSEDDLHLQH